MQHTATHCNTLQHTATLSNMHMDHHNYMNTIRLHCNTLQHTATHCNTLQHTITWIQLDYIGLMTSCKENTFDGRGSTLQHTATHCNMQMARQYYTSKIIQYLQAADRCQKEQVLQAQQQHQNLDSSSLPTPPRTHICTYQRGMWHTWMRHVTQMNEKYVWHGWTSV